MRVAHLEVYLSGRIHVAS